MDGWIDLEPGELVDIAAQQLSTVKQSHCKYRG
jgi:hypothetical protein